MDIKNFYKLLGVSLTCKMLMHRFLRQVTKGSRKGYHYNLYSVFYFVSKNKGRISKTAGGYLVEVSVKSVPVAFVIRQNSSDAAVFRQVFIEHEYLPMINLIQSFQPNDIGTIIDAGANVGFTAIQFSAFFPKARIISIEADFANYKSAESNVALSKRSSIEVIHKALWRSNEELYIESTQRDRLEWSRSVTDKFTGQKFPVKGITLAEVLDLTGGGVDLLKIDIEGAEKEFFSDAATSVTLLRKVKFLVMELHDEIAFKDAFEDILRKSGFAFTHVNESLIAFNLAYVPRLRDN